jgi:hypothetical protein
MEMKYNLKMIKWYSVYSKKIYCIINVKVYHKNEHKAISIA